MNHFDSMTIKTCNLTKYYGSSPGVLDLNLTIQHGEIFGFLGPNGAGKTTTIRSLLGLIKPSKGGIQLFGKNITTHLSDCLQDIGYLPGDIGLYKDFTGIQYLTHFMKLRKKEQDENSQNRLKQLITSFNIDFEKKIKSYSKGMRQIVGIIQAFLHAPKLLILDEPTTGLDPMMQEVFYNLLIEMKKMGKTIFLSSHILNEVERVCDRVGIIKKGKYLCTENLKEKNVLIGKKITLTIPSEQIPDCLKNLSGVQELTVTKGKINFFYSGDISALLQCLTLLNVKDLSCETPSIEDAFFNYYKD
jgi:ABC-2 type transport system ATP-binding protein